MDTTTAPFPAGTHFEIQIRTHQTGWQTDGDYLTEPDARADLRMFQIFNWPGTAIRIAAVSGVTGKTIRELVRVNGTKGVR